MKKSKETQRNDRLRQARIGRNWRQHELAEQLGTTTETIKRWERGSQQPSSYFRIKLCTLFSKSAQQLGLNEEEPLACITEEDVSDGEPAGISPREPGALWIVPYMRNPHFTGRDDLLERLAQELSWEKSDAMSTRQAVLSQPQAIKGLGGIGKTQIAVEYAYRARERERYCHTFWINAASQEAILTSFQTLAGQLPNFAEKDEKDQHKLIAAVLHWIEQCPQSWLLIADNADDLSLIQPYLPKQGRGSILLTTRATAVRQLATSIEVEQMGLMEGAQFLLHRTGRLSASDEEYNEATNIVIALDAFPLALDQAGAYIEETGCSFGDYLRLYERHRAQLLARRGMQAANYPASVATTWDLSFQKIEQVHPAAAELLRLCASLSPDHIPEELLTEAAEQWPPVLRQAVADRFTFNELLEALLAFSLVKRLAQEHLLSIHRLVQVVQLDRMELQEQHVWAERVVHAVHTLFPADPKEKVEIWPLCQRYLEQVQACDSLIQRYHLLLPEAAELLDRAGIYLREHASYSLAEPLFQRGLALAEQQLEPCPLLVASLLYNLGILYAEQGEYEQAEPLLQRALHIREQTLGQEHPLLAYPLNSLGLLYGKQGRYEQAEPLLQRAVHIREQALGLHHPLLAYPLNNLGMLYSEQGKYEQAEPLLQRAVRIREQELGLHHPLLASPLGNLGILYAEQGKFEQAEWLLQRALHIQEQMLGLHHPGLAYPLVNLGDLCYEQSKFEQAEPLYRRALCIWEQALGSDHPLLAAPLAGLANLARDQGKYEQADGFYQRALTLRQEHLGSQHLATAETLQDLARLRQMQRCDAEARSLYQRALAIRERIMGTHHPRTCETREHLRTMSGALGKTQEAAALE